MKDVAHAEQVIAPPAGREGTATPLILRPARGWTALDLRELWHYRELMFFLAWRDNKVRYRQTALGVAWAVPLFILLAAALALRVGPLLSALNLRYGDVRYTIPFFAQMWLLATPITYPSSLVPPGWRDLVGLNPMAGVVDAPRWPLLGSGAGPGALLGVSVLVTGLLVASGLAYFRRMERTFADAL